MQQEHKLLIAAGIGTLLLAPVWKCGRKKGISLVQVLWGHTIFADPPAEQMVEDSYQREIEELGIKTISEAY